MGYTTFGGAEADEVLTTVERIDCPTLVLAGEDDHFVPLALAQEFVDELTAPTTLRVFTAEEGAGEHCQVGNLRLATGVVYDWLDGTLTGGNSWRD